MKDIITTRIGNTSSTYITSQSIILLIILIIILIIIFFLLFWQLQQLLSSWRFFFPLLFFFFCSYLKGLSINQDVFGDDGVDQPPVSLGLFGLGRAGTIHLNNILANRKFELKYIVEDDDSKWKSVTKKLNLKGITFLRSSEAQTLYDDKDLEGFGDHLLTLLCLWLYNYYLHFCQLFVYIRMYICVIYSGNSRHTNQQSWGLHRQ